MSETCCVLIPVPANTLSARKSGAGCGGGDMSEMSPAELAAYINEIVENLPDGNETPETALRAVAAAITKLVDEVAELAEESERMRQYLDELDSDLGELEADYYSDIFNFDFMDWPSGVSHCQPIIFSEQPSADEHSTQSAQKSNPRDDGRDEGRG